MLEILEPAAEQAVMLVAQAVMLVNLHHAVLHEALDYPNHHMEQASVRLGQASVQESAAESALESAAESAAELERVQAHEDYGDHVVDCPNHRKVPELAALAAQASALVVVQVAVLVVAQELEQAAEQAAALV